MKDSLPTWEVPRSHPRLAENAVHVWCASLVQPAPVVHRLLTFLPADEQQRARRFRFQRGRRQFLVGRGALRLILAGYLGVRPEQIEFGYQRWGKPVLASAAGRPDLRFNLAHAQDLVLIAVTRGFDVGIDLEFIKPVTDLLRIAERFFSPTEYTALQALPEQDQLLGFFNCWTRKEAFIKATGRGLTQPLHCFDVTLRPGEPARLLRIAGRLRDTSSWYLASLQPAPGYVGAVAAHGGERVLDGWYLVPFDTL